MPYRGTGAREAVHGKMVGTISEVLRQSAAIEQSARMRHVGGAHEPVEFVFADEAELHRFLA